MRIAAFGYEPYLKSKGSVSTLSGSDWAICKIIRQKLGLNIVAKVIPKNAIQIQLVTYNLK